MVNSRTEPDEATNDTAPVEPTGLRRGLAAFYYRNYRLFWFGQVISVTGTWVQSLAQTWLMYDILGASASQLGLVNAAQFGPVLFLGILAGIVGDRFPKRTILLCTQVTFSVIAATLATLTFTGNIEMWHVFTLATLFGITNAFDMPTRQAFVSEMVDKSVLTNAIAMNSALFNTGRILGPAIAGVILAAFGPAVCFALNAVSYIAVITGLAMMKLKPIIGRAAGSTGSRLLEGLRYVRTTQDVLLPIILAGWIGCFAMGFNVWLPLLAGERFDGGSSTYAILFGSMGAGSLLGALSLAFFGRRPSRKRMLLAAGGMGVALTFLAGAATIGAPVIVGALLLACSGFAGANTMATANTTVQTTAPDELRARVMAVYMTVFAGSVPVGALIAGTISDALGVASSVLIGGIIAIATVIVLAFIMQRRPDPLSQSEFRESTSQPST